MTEHTCACNSGPKLIFACSGAADVGLLADQTARSLNRSGDGKMYCLAGIGGKVSGILETTKSASAILAIDGCPQECARKTLDAAGIAPFQHLRLAELGFEKGKTPVLDESIERAANKAKELL